MDIPIVIFMVVSIIAVAMVLYLWIKMRQQLDDTNNQLASATTQLANISAADNTLSTKLNNESTTRAATLTNVVDQVNDVNDSIYGAVTSNANLLRSGAIYFNSQLNSNVNSINSNVNMLQNQQNSINSGLGRFMVFKANADGSGPSVPLAALPGIANPDVQLIQHVTSTMGMTVNDLHAGTMTVNGDLNLRNNWKLQTQGDQLCFVHGINTVACLSDGAEKLQVYKNSDKKSPYLYYNSTGELGNNPGGPYQSVSAATAAQATVSQTATQAAAAGATASQVATQTASQAATIAQTALTAAQAAAAQASAAQSAATAAQTAATSAATRVASVATSVATSVAASPATIPLALPATPAPATPAKVYPLDTISAPVLTVVRGLWALKRLLTSYTGPIIQLTNMSNTVPTNFYCDSSGNLWSGPNGSGTSLAAWMTANGINNTSTYAFVSAWYDQSGKNANATQTTSGRMPRYNPTKNVIDFGSPNINTYLNLPNGTMPQNNNPWSATWKTGTVGTGVGSDHGGTIAFGGNLDGTREAGFGVYAPSNAAYYTWSYYGDWTTPISSVSNNVASFVWNGTSAGTMSLYVNGVSQATNNMSGFVGGSGTYDSIGRDAHQGTYNNGELYYLALFQAALPSTDRVKLESQ